MSSSNASTSRFSSNSDDIEPRENQPTQSTMGQKAVPSSNDSLGSGLEIVSLLSHLALFGIIGTLVRFGSNVLFGPSVLRITDNESILFLDLPSNMIGCFVMGFVGFVFKNDLIDYSEHLAIGLSTGLCGSITTFASWNQRLLTIMAKRQWQQGFAGYIAGASLSYMSFIVGADFASGLKLILDKKFEKSPNSASIEKQKSPDYAIFTELNKLNRKWIFLMLTLASSAFLWIGSIVGSLMNSSCLKTKKMFVGCALAPFGVWIRWYLSRYNFMDIGNPGQLKWFPLGTFVANISAVVLEAVSSIIDIIVATRTSTYLLGGFQLGFLGSMSTVSTLVMESYNMHNGEKKMQSYIYYLSTVFLSILLGILIYAVPIWTTDYQSRYNYLRLC